MTPDEAAGETLAYGDAVAELERILAELDDDAVDVDVLATRVRRAAELIRICRERIASARLEIERVVADLELDGDLSGDADEDRDTDGEDVIEEPTG
jgi:exodeoxyribonuclease VII small subunit